MRQRKSESGASEAAYAPPGWGYRPGVMLAGDDACIEAALPDLPLLGQVSSATRGMTVSRALSTVPGIIPRLRPRHLRRRYGLPSATAQDAIKRACTDLFNSWAPREAGSA